MPFGDLFHVEMFMQRFFDLLFSSVAIIFLLPLLIPVMVILRFTGEGEVFFRQARVGKGKVSFNLLKFATMLKNSEQIGAGTVTLKDDFRVLPLELVSIGDLLSIQDIDGDTPVTVGFLDRRNNAGGGQFQVQGADVPQAQWTFYNFGELDDVLYQGANSGESEVISVLVFDGFSFSEEFSFTVTTLAPPVITPTTPAFAPPAPPRRCTRRRRPTGCGSRVGMLTATRTNVIPPSPRFKRGRRR